VEPLGAKFFLEKRPSKSHDSQRNKKAQKRPLLLSTPPLKELSSLMGPGKRWQLLFKERMGTF